MCSLSSHTSPSWFAGLSDRTYEFFLVHGTVYLALATYFHVPIAVNVVVGTGLAGGMAYVLRWMIDTTQQLIPIPVLHGSDAT